MPLKITHFSNTILSQISFELERGENLIILGSNGVGKTTLAKTLCGINPSSTVTIDNINPLKIQGKKRTRLINYIPPKLDIFDEFITVREFLELGIITGIVRVQHPTGINGVLEKLNIIHLSDKTCKTLSSGESQLLLIASALLHDADYTIFDEPTANLDPQKMQTLFALFKDNTLLKSKIIITHNLDLAYKLGFNILYLADKKVAFHGSSLDFFEQSHLNSIYDGSVQNIAGNMVVKL